MRLQNIDSRYFAYKYPEFKYLRSNEVHQKHKSPARWPGFWSDLFYFYFSERDITKMPLILNSIRLGMKKMLFLRA